MSREPRTKIRFTNEFVIEFLSLLIATDSGCWEWTGKLNSCGYGDVQVPGFHYWRTHRVAFALLVSSLTPGLYVLHTCHNRRCCNPYHLYEGTHSDNMNDMVDSGRSMTGLRGGNKLDLAGRERLVALWNSGATAKECAEDFGISVAYAKELLKKEREIGRAISKNFPRTNTESQGIP